MGLQLFGVPSPWYRWAPSHMRLAAQHGRRASGCPAGVLFFETVELHRLLLFSFFSNCINFCTEKTNKQTWQFDVNGLGTRCSLPSRFSSFRLFPTATQSHRAEQ